MLHIIRKYLQDLKPFHVYREDTVEGFCSYYRCLFRSRQDGLNYVMSCFYNDVYIFSTPLELLAPNDFNQLSNIHTHVCLDFKQGILTQQDLARAEKDYTERIRSKFQHLPLTAINWRPTLTLVFDKPDVGSLILVNRTIVPIRVENTIQFNELKGEIIDATKIKYITAT